MWCGVVQYRMVWYITVYMVWGGMLWYYIINPFKFKRPVFQLTFYSYSLVLKTTEAKLLYVAVGHLLCSLLLSQKQLAKPRQYLLLVPNLVIDDLFSFFVSYLNPGSRVFASGMTFSPPGNDGLFGTSRLTDVVIVSINGCKPTI